MKPNPWIALAAAAVAGQAAAACPAEGETIQWIADYCMLKAQTDDEIAASGCIRAQSKRRFTDDCAARLHYKRRMCERVFRNGTRPDVDRCVADPAFKGRTVEAGGVGGHPSR